MCKFQLELVSSGGLSLLDFLLGGDPLVYFMEVVITAPLTVYTCSSFITSFVSAHLNGGIC